MVGARRRVILVGAGDGLERLRRQLTAHRRGVTYEIVGAVAPVDQADIPLLGRSVDELPEILEAVRPDEVILAEADFDEGTVLGIVERAHRLAVKVRLAPNTTELLVREGEYVPGSGVPALRSPATDPRRLGLGSQAGLRPRSSARRCSSSGCRSGF